MDFMTLALKSETSYTTPISNSVLFPARYSLICDVASFRASVSHSSIGGRLLFGRYTPVILPFPSSVMLTVPIRVRNDQMHSPAMNLNRTV